MWRLYLPVSILSEYALTRNFVSGTLRCTGNSKYGSIFDNLPVCISLQFWIFGSNHGQWNQGGAITPTSFKPWEQCIYFTPRVFAN